MPGGGNSFSTSRFLVVLGLVVGLLAGGVSGLAPALAQTPKPSKPLEVSGQPAPARVGHSKPPSTPPRSSNTTGAADAATQQAASKAHATGKATPVDGLTTETQQTTANPKGGFTFTETIQPVRTQRNGQWVPVDTTLHRNPDGTVSPMATAYGAVVFSSGGTDPVATTTSGSTSFAMSWLTPLPAPTLHGDQATYAGVLPGVDLVMTANVTGGFSDVLVVHDANAARNPALTHLNLPVHVTGGRLTATSSGGLRLTPTGPGRTLIADTPSMWDSNATLTTGQAGTATSKAAASVTPDPSDSGHAGLAARVAAMPVTVTGSAISLNPDPRLLTGDHTVYPVFLDPTVQWSNTGGSGLGFAEAKQGAPCAGTSFYDGNQTGGEAMGVGFNHWSSCIGIQRAYYQWNLPTGQLAGATIGQATVNLPKVYSAASISTTDYLHLAGQFPIVGGVPNVSWNDQPGPGMVIGSTSVGAAQRASATCPPGGAVAYAGFSVTGVLNPGWSTFAVDLTGNESSSSSNVEFSRFAPCSGGDAVQPTLNIQYNRAPYTPAPVKAFAGSDNVGCNTNATGPYPYMGATMLNNPPVLEANIGDPDGNIVAAKFQYWVSGSSTINTVTSADLPSGSTAMASLSPSFVSGLSNGQVVNWNVAAFDGQLWSPWSVTCHYTAEPTAPTEPTVASADGAYQTTDSGQVAATMAPADRWLLNDGNGTTAADTAKTNPATLTGSAVAWTKDPTEGEVLGLGDETGYAVTKTPAVTTTASFSVSAWVNLTSTRTYYTAVSQGGANIGGFYLQYNKNLNAWAFLLPSSDSASPAQFFGVSQSTPPTLDTWTNLIGTFDASSGMISLYVNGTLVGTATDTSPWNAPGPLTIGGVQLTGGSANNLFNGAVSDVQVYNGVLPATDAALIATPIRTFTGSAHAGTPGSFTLSTPSTNATEIVYGLDQTPPTSNPPASQVTSNFTGGVAAVPAGRWKLADGSGSTAADTGGNHNATLTTGATWTQDSSRNSQVLALSGSTGYATTTGPVVATNASYSVSAWVKLADTNNYYTAVSQSGSNVAGFYLQYSKGLNAWAIVIPATDTGGAGQYIAHGSAPAVNTWTHLVATVDATTGLVTLYVNGVSVGTVTDSQLWNAAGPLTIGAATPTTGKPSNYVNGDIADVQVYGRALTASEVAALYGTVTVTLTPKAPGPHAIYAYAEDAAGDTSGTSHKAYQFQATGDPADTTTCTSWQACLTSQYGNTAVQNGTTSSGTGADGTNSIAAADLAAAGWHAGGTITIDGATFTLPNFGTGPDNVLAANQTIAGNFGMSTIPSAGTTSLLFLATATGDTAPDPNAKTDQCTAPGNISAPAVPTGTPMAGAYAFNGVNPAELCSAQGVISYNDGYPQHYTLDVPDWLSGPSSLAAVTLPHLNTPTGQDGTRSPKIYAISVPLKPDAASLAIKSITLPDVSSHADAGNQALHIFGIAVRNTTTTNAPANQAWTAAWASPTEGTYNFNNATINQQTYRVALKPTLSGGNVRIKLDDALGTTPLTIGAATIALDANTTTPTATAATGSVTTLTFGGSSTVTIPEGGMVYSDTVTSLHVTANQYVLVSFWLNNPSAIPYLPEHTWSSTAWEFTAPANTTSHAADVGSSAFTGANGPLTNVVTGLDIGTATNSTGMGTPTQAVLGDNLVDPSQPNANANSQVDLAANFSTAEPTAPAAYGSIGEGIEANEITADNPQTFDNGAIGGPSALSRIDRDILDQPGITTVILDEGLEDVLHGATRSTMDASYTALLNYLNDYGITVIVVGLTPCGGYAGDGATNANDPCTTSVDTVRQLVNGDLATANHVSYYIDPDQTLGSGNGSPPALNSTAATTDKANLTPAGYAALATAYLGSQDNWPLNAASYDPTTTTITDANNDGSTKTPYTAINNLPYGGHDATLSASGWTWTTDSTGRNVLSLDGQQGDATTASTVLDTSHSFTLSAWAYLSGSSLPATDAVVVSQDGANASAASLRYDATDQKWAFTMSTQDATSTTQLKALSQFTPTLGAWTHLVGIYNANTRSLALYVNAAANGTATWPTGTASWTPTGPLTIGASTGSDFFPGNLCEIQAWNYALSPDQTSALYEQIQQPQQ